MNKTISMNNGNKYIFRCVLTNTIFHFRTTTELTTNISTAIAKALGIQSHSQIVEIIVRSVSQINLPFTSSIKTNKLHPRFSSSSTSPSTAS